ncbi:MAG: ChbG/HpnK family deacetylase [Clostridia bacterium]|nr:ChbG/HpnK family deacetylase [Clostridia bacterium]
MGVIINADDFGLNERCSMAIAEAFSKGLITDTTMMASGDFFDGAVSLCREKGFDNRIGIHFNITEGTPLTDDIKNFRRFTENGKFHGRINRLKPLSKAEKNAVYEELSAQIARIEGTGLKITHADSHHHIHTAVFIAPVVIKVCREHGVAKIRLHRNIGDISLPKRLVKKAYNSFLHKKGFITTRFFGSMEDLGSELDNLEIMVHPDYDKDGNLIDRIDEAGGYPIGKELKKIGGNIKLTGYGEL